MESMVEALDKKFWNGKRVFITGNTGFKGSWLCALLGMLGAEIKGYSLEPPTMPSMYELIRADEWVQEVKGDVRDLSKLQYELEVWKPEIVFHLAAQPLVRESYLRPADTYEINVMGTVNILEAVRNYGNLRAFINITTDKVYENKEWVWPYRENDALGGYDPYANSKACSELATAAYRSSFFDSEDSPTGICTARAGNVIGGGDWACDRLIPDCVRAAMEGKPIIIRNPDAIRPWQHVLEPLTGYLKLAEKLYSEKLYSGNWNFGPGDDGCINVRKVVERFCSNWPGSSYKVIHNNSFHETNFLKLDSSKSRTRIGWRPSWTLEKSIDMTVEWYKAYFEKQDLRDITIKQIKVFFNE